MKSPSEIAVDVVTKWTSDKNVIIRPHVKGAEMEILVDLVGHAITTERQRQERLIELVDGCTPVIESWAVISVAQAEWKKRWLSEAQQALKEVK